MRNERCREKMLLQTPADARPAQRVAPASCEGLASQQVLCRARLDEDHPAQGSQNVSAYENAGHQRRLETRDVEVLLDGVERARREGARERCIEAKAVWDQGQMNKLSQKCIGEYSRRR